MLQSHVQVQDNPSLDVTGFCTAAKDEMNLLSTGKVYYTFLIYAEGQRIFQMNGGTGFCDVHIFS